MLDDRCVNTDERCTAADAGASASPGWTTVTTAAGAVERAVPATRWLHPHDDLDEALLAAVGPHVRPGDTVAVSEKVVVVLGGGLVDARTVQVSRLARVLVRGVQPVGSSRGLSVPEKMQYVLDTVGPARLLRAALLGIVSRLFGRRGVFYRVAGPVARDLDGMRPPYEGFLIPPLDPAEALQVADRLRRRLGVAVAVVDINDRGGSVRAVTADGLPADVVAAALKDNPMGQRDRGTPFVVLRPAGPHA